jgi:hypothetical protein
MKRVSVIVPTTPVYLMPGAGFTAVEIMEPPPIEAANH